MIESAQGFLRARPRLIAAGAAAAVLASATLNDPHRPHRLIRCPVKAVTGLDCPGCGGLRMLHDLLHGRLRLATHDNPFLLVAGLPLGVLMVRTLMRGPEVEPVPTRMATGLGAAAVGWALIRNLPGWPLKPLVVEPQAGGAGARPAA